MIIVAMIPVSISKATRQFVINKKKYNDVYANKIGAFTEGYRSEIFKVKSFLTNYKLKDDLLYIPLNLAKVVVDAYSSYVLSKDIITTVRDGSDEQQEILEETISNENIIQKLIQATKKQSYLGYSLIRVRAIDGDPDNLRIENIPVKNYYPITEGLPLGNDIRDLAQHSIVSIVKSPDGKNEAHVDHYERQPDGTRWGQYSVHTFSKVVDTWKFDDSNLLYIKDEEPLQHLPLFIFNNDINNDEDELSDRSHENTRGWTINTNVSSDYFADSDLGGVMEILQEVNDRRTQLSVEYIKHGNSKMSIPAGTARKLQKANKRNADSEHGMGNADVPSPERTVHEAGEQPAQYIVKSAEYLTHIVEFIKMNIASISTITSVPLHRFGLDLGGQKEAVESKEKSLESFYFRVEQKRSIIEPEIKRMLGYIMRLKQGATGELPKINITFPELFQDNVDEKAITYGTLFDKRLISQKSAMMKIMNIDEEEATEELNKINAEGVNNLARDQGSFLDDNV